MEALGPIIGWFAPILSTIIITAATASINAHIKRHEQIAEERNAKTEQKRREEAEWRERMEHRMEEIERKMEEQDDKMMSVLKSQVTQMRSDTLHRIHRYLDDLGMASTEEKTAFWAEYEEYCELCEKYGIENNFVKELAQRVMDLPEREI